MAFDERKAQRVTRFIEALKHTKGEFHGKPFVLLPWQEKVIRDVFGTVRDDDPTMRQYNTAYIEIPKKNGKSELGAALALNMLINDDEWKAEVYSCASDRQQAAIVFDVAVDMVRQSPALMKRIKIIPSAKRMVYQPTGSIYQVLSSEVATKHGLNVSACIFDELHTQPTRALYDVMTQGSGDARKQPLWFFLTTAGTDRNSICWEVHQKAVDIIEGRKVDPRFYPVIFGLPDEADWTSEENWYKANPSLGETISIGSVPAGSERSRVFHRVRMRQDAAGASAVGEELASVLLSGDTQTDSGLFKCNGAITHDTVKAKPGNMKHIPRFEPPAFAIAGCISVGQKTTSIPVNFHLVRKKRIQAVDLVSAGADNLAVGIAVQQQMSQHRFSKDKRSHFLVGLVMDQPVQRMFRGFSASVFCGFVHMERQTGNGLSNNTHTGVDRRHLNGRGRIYRLARCAGAEIEGRR